MSPLSYVLSVAAASSRPGYVGISEVRDLTVNQTSQVADQSFQGNVAVPANHQAGAATAAAAQPARATVQVATGGESRLSRASKWISEAFRGPEQCPMLMGRVAKYGTFGE